MGWVLHLLIWDFGFVFFWDLTNRNYWNYTGQWLQHNTIPNVGGSACVKLTDKEKSFKNTLLHCILRPKRLPILNEIGMCSILVTSNCVIDLSTTGNTMRNTCIHNVSDFIQDDIEILLLFVKVSFYFVVKWKPNQFGTLLSQYWYIPQRNTFSISMVSRWKCEDNNGNENGKPKEQTIFINHY